MNLIVALLAVLLVAALLTQPAYTRYGWYGGGGIWVIVLVVLLFLVLTGNVHAASLEAPDVSSVSPLPTNPLDANAIMLIGVPVVGLTQLSKWMAIPDQWGPLVVLIFATAGVTLWAWAYGGFHQYDAFNYFVATISVALQAAGIYGFTRATASAITATKSPPPGAGQSVTVRS